MSDLIHKIVGKIIEVGQSDTTKFRLGEIIRYSPSEILEILKQHESEIFGEGSSTQTNTSNVLNALDCISRQDAINAMLKLQAEDDEAYGCHIPEGFDGERAKEALEVLPSAQPEIIRCEECRHYRTCEIFGKKITLCKRREYDALSVEPDDFCSYAERKEQDDG